MVREDFWYPPELQRLPVAPTGCRVGQFLFLSAQVPRDLETGAMVRELWELPADAQEKLVTGFEHRDGREGPIKAQTWTVYSNLSRILASQGSSLERILRQRIYLKTPQDIAPMESTMLDFFPGDKPATTISCVSSSGSAQELRIEVEVIALVPEAGGIQQEAISLPDLELLTRPYPQAVRAGQMLFFSGILGLDPRTGRALTRLGELDEAARGILATRCYHSDVAEQALKAQIAGFFSHMQRVLESQGGSLDDLVRQNFLSTTGMAEWGIASMEYRSQLVTGKQAAPTSTSVTVPAVNGDREVVIVSDATALLPGEWKKEPVLDTGIDMAFLPMTIGAGPFAFTTGFVAMDKSFHGPVRSFAELGDEGRLLGTGRFDANETLIAQAWYTYRAIDEMLRGAGSGLTRVVQQTVLMRDATQYPALESVALKLYEGQLPPTTVLSCDDIGPYPGLLFEVETVAVRA
ncbi:MAG: hypothetical protein IT307_03220 [Chloroflexi bacterium]|nr:hypothetical protein [Chloroflexota bacterium]